MDSVTVSGTSPLLEVDQDVQKLMEKEKRQQFRWIELGPSDTLTSFAVGEATGYALSSNSRDALKNICCDRALKAFHLDDTCWGVTVQFYSGCTARDAAYTAVLEKYSRIMGPNLTYGYNTSGSKKFCFESIPFDSSTGCIIYEKLEQMALEFGPRLIICGSSAYPRDWDYSRFRSIADKCGARLLCDMVNISGHVVAQEAANPFEYCHIVTTTTYKSLRGPTAGMIFYRKDQPESAVLASLQDRPYNNQIIVLAVSLDKAMSPKFKDYGEKVKANAVALVQSLLRKGNKLVTGGTDNHLVLWDLRPLGLTGNKVEKLCHNCGITVNKNAVFGDSSTKAAKGIVIGTQTMTFRGFVEEDFQQIGEFLHRAVTIASTIQQQHGKRMKDFEKGLYDNEDIKALKDEVERFGSPRRHAQFLSCP